MLLYSFALLVGFLVLFKSADYFVIGSVATANNLKISPMVIGLTVVALGTSAPEIFVAAAASLDGEAELAAGNAIGSNIANIGLVIGITALLVPLPFKRESLENDLPIMIFVAMCAGATLIDLNLGLWDGILLLAGFAVFLYRIGATDRENLSMESVAEVADLEEIPEISTVKAIGILLLSLVFLLVSAEVLVWSVVKIAGTMGVSELVIGLTVIAVGTSLPELVVSVTSALKQQTDLAIGNIIGSNIFNILAVLAIPGLLAPSVMSPDLLYRDFPTMIAMTLAMVFFAYFGIGGKYKVTRIEGGILLVGYFAYIAYLYQSAVQH